MNSIKFLAFVRAVERVAAAWGYYGDVLANVEVIPLVGNSQQQFDQCAIYLDVRPRPTNERERNLLKRLIRAAVLTSPPSESSSVTPPGSTAKFARERARRRAQ